MSRDVKHPLRTTKREHCASSTREAEGRNVTSQTDCHKERHVTHSLVMFVPHTEWQQSHWHTHITTCMTASHCNTQGEEVETIMKYLENKKGGGASAINQNNSQLPLVWWWTLAELLWARCNHAAWILKRYIKQLWPARSLWQDEMKHATRERKVKDTKTYQREFNYRSCLSVHEVQKFTRPF